MPINVMPICTVDKNFVGFSESSKADFAPLLPFFFAYSNLNLREETNDISDIEKTPLSNTNAIIIKISIVYINHFIATEKLAECSPKNHIVALIFFGVANIHFAFQIKPTTQINSRKKTINQLHGNGTFSVL